MLRLFWSGIFWHYTTAYKEIVLLCKNYIWFILHLFSIRDLSKTLFLPWQRLGERYQGGFNIGAWFSTFVINTLMRVLGFVARLFVILTGLVCACIVSVLSVIFIVVWTAIPFLMVFLFITSFRLFFQ